MKRNDLEDEAFMLLLSLGLVPLHVTRLNKEPEKQCGKKKKEEIKWQCHNAVTHPISERISDLFFATPRVLYSNK